MLGATGAQSLAGAVLFSIYLHKYPSCSKGKQLQLSLWGSCGEREDRIPDEKTLKSGRESQHSPRNVARKEKELKDFFQF